MPFAKAVVQRLMQQIWWDCELSLFIPLFITMTIKIPMHPFDIKVMLLNPLTISKTTLNGNNDICLSLIL